MKSLFEMTLGEFAPELDTELARIVRESGLPAARANWHRGEIGGAYLQLSFVFDHRKSGQDGNSVMEHLCAKGTIGEALGRFEEKVQAALIGRRATLVKRLALDLIELGQDATEAKLRSKGWSGEELDGLGEEAEGEAGRLADAGPFRIVRSRGGNEPKSGLVDDEISF